jgi:hypothetical protein
MDIMLSNTARRLTKLAKAAGATLEVIPSKGGITEVGNRAQWTVNGKTGDAAFARNVLKALLTPTKKEKK